MPAKTKTAIVTGGLSGMGLAIARRLAKDGTHVFVGARRAGDAAHVAAQLGPDAGHITAEALDVQARDSVDRFVANVVAARGSVDILVNAAGIYDEAAICDHPDDIWDTQIDINLSGSFRMIRAVMPHMIDQRWGRIINIASMAAHTGMANNAAYCASKAGLLGLGRCVSLEGAEHGVTCVSISPTWVETEMLRKFIAADMAATGQTLETVRADYAKSNPQNQLVQPEEVAELAAYLASDAARAVTMSDFEINAGSPW
ncbi:D-beta-hydroxybutyrate dehydrogenase [Tritonibacter multivorans]|uniref:D-beta-hydroxybutyrate dehydrogenase n=1 Tax=Tritonibacter multivorans TaxID=928856 RepID=A0A0P1G4S7_9RHOB|nr:SDR family oxidoreductase [Tritonibacter multivorans]MDA7421825.1 SDR family NAD(P)-dependent oxidoreductase [Tritonibacter multivorans]CUH76803.1 D-beta-hydroxybutyrate dehydrogenase [Tritonibacter multivorans]SFD06654.1 NAD(P)-dependent dehydrogenase, short-chain alcohol dehydrogenase family [Tritonibacter multivorans]